VAGLLPVIEILVDVMEAVEPAGGRALMLAICDAVN
jgi:hypothetical protein